MELAIILLGTMLIALIISIHYQLEQLEKNRKYKHKRSKK